MATREQLLEALRAADAAGDTAAATAIATRLQSLQAASSPVAPTPAAPQAPEGYTRAGGYGPKMAGVADAAIRGFIGIKDAFGLINPVYGAYRTASGEKALEDQIIREQEAEFANDPNKYQRMAGNVAANVAAAAVPMSHIARGTTALTTMLPRALGVPAAGAAVSGAQGLILNPAEGEDATEQLLNKLKSSGTDALWGAGLASGGAVLKKALTKPFRATEEAIRLFREGINPTLQQAADSRIGRFIGGLTSGAINVRDRQNKEVVDAFLKRVAPNLDTTKMTVPEKVALLKHQFGADYDKLFDGKVFKMGQPERSAIWSAARGPKGTHQEAIENATRELGGVGGAMTSTNRVSMQTDRMKYYRDLLQDAINRYNSNNGVVEASTKQNLIKAREAFDTLVRNKALSPDELAQLADIDSRYGDFLRFASAAEKPSFHSKPRVADLLREYSQANPADFAVAGNKTQRELLEPAARVMGMTPTQDEARSLISAIKRIGKGAATAGVGAGAAVGNPAALALAPAYGLSLAGQTGPGARVLFGETAMQRALAEAMMKSSPYLLGSGHSLTGEQ